MECPGHNTVAAYVDGELPAYEVGAVEAHLDSCPSCRDHIATIAKVLVSRSLVSTEAADEVRAPSRVLGPGTRVGRLVVLGFLGRGGMGQVVEAYDPELERHVALKVLERVDADRERLQREAIAMAKLAHPNVVMVFDVATWGEQLCVAMELVRGATLDQWVRAAKPSRREILDACLAAGRGIAAAHAAGIVHRDLKPANVLRGSDGRVRVSDFGLAALAGAVAAVGGTPGYISPEQKAGGAVDARSDQYSFSVMVWELLAGEKPPNGRVPAAVRRVLVRGMAERPEAPYPTIDALLAALRSAAARPRRILLAAAAATVIAAGVGYAFASRHDDVACSGAEQHLAGVWDPGRRAAVEAAFGGAPDAARFAAILDDRTSSWVATQTAACRATAHAEQSPQLLDARMQCLDEQLGEIRALVDAVAAKTGLAHATDAARSLPAATACSATAVGARGKPVQFPEPLASKAAALDRVLEDARVRIVLVDLPGAKQLLDRADAELAGIPDPIRHARAAFHRGRLLIGTHEPDRAAEALTRAALLAARAGDRRLVAIAGTNMIRLLENNTDRAAEGRAWEATVEAEAAAGAGDDVLGDLEESRAVIAFNRRDFRAARDHAQRAVELEEHVFGKDAPEEIVALQLLARAIGSLDGRAGAQPIFQRALAIAERAYGPDHPLVATTLADMSIVEMGAPRAEVEQARKTFERVLAIRERAYGPDHPLVEEALHDLGDLALTLGDLPAAQRYIERVIAIEKSRGPDANLADPLFSLGQLYQRQGKLPEARQTLQQVIAVTEQRHGASYPGLMGPLIFLGDVELATGGCKTAAPIYDRAFHLKPPDAGDPGPTSYMLLQLAVCDLEANNAPRALERARLAESIRTKAHMPPPLLAETQFTVAQALERTGQRAQALAEGEAAQKIADPSFAKEMTPWLADVRAGKHPALVK